MHRCKGSIWGKLALLTVVGTLAFNAAATVLLTPASMANYPGGTALALLNERYADSAHGGSTLPVPAPIDQLMNVRVRDATVHVHVANLAAQSGASLFLHIHAPPYRERIGILPPIA